MTTTRNKAQLAQAIGGCLKNEAEYGGKIEITNVSGIGLTHHPNGIDK